MLPVAVLLSGFDALAASSSIRVRVEPERAECIGGEELEQRLWSLPQAHDSKRDHVVEVRFESEGSVGHAATVVVRTPANAMLPRRVTTQQPDCRDLDDALVVVIDALTSETSVAESPEKTANEPRREAGVRPEEDARPGTRSVALPEQPKARVPHLVVGGAGYDVGALPHPTWVARLDARLSIASSFAVRFGVGTNPVPTAENAAGASVAFRLTTARGLGCYDLLGSVRGYIDLCAGLDAGTISTTSDGLENDTSTLRLALWPLGQASAGFRFGPLFSEALVMGGPALVRDAYEVQDLSGATHTVHRSEPFRFGAGIALGVALR